MANSTQFANKAQEATRSIFQAVQGAVSTQLNVAQRLDEIQQRGVRRAIEASNEELQLIGNLRDPRAFANAQAYLVKRHGQRYVEDIQQAIDIAAEAWQDYGDQLEGTVNIVKVPS
jgi:pimeloyl-CoA synthetase